MSLTKSSKSYSLNERFVGLKGKINTDSIPNIIRALKQSPKLVSPDLDHDTLFSKALEECKSMNSSIRQCDKNLGLCVTDNDWFIRHYCDLIQKLLVRKKFQTSDVQTMVVSESVNLVENFRKLVKQYDFNQRLGSLSLFRKLENIVYTSKQKKLKDKWSSRKDRIDFASLCPIVKIHKCPVQLRPVITAPIYNPWKDMSREVSGEIWNFIRNDTRVNSVTMNIQNWCRFHRLRPKHLNDFVTADIESFYTNITDSSVKHSLEFLSQRIPERKTFFEMIFHWYMVSKEWMLLKIDNSFYTISHGCAMGSSDAPSIATLVRLGLESKLMFGKKLTPNTNLWLLGYVDDVIIYFNNQKSSKSSVQQLVEQIFLLRHFFNIHNVYSQF